MIGVLAPAAHHAAVREFFELFKTPWELYRDGRPYDVIVDADGTAVHDAAPLTVVYGARATAFDRQHGALPHAPRPHGRLTWNGRVIPLHGEVACFAAGADRGELVLGGSEQPVARLTHAGRQTVLRVGYDLFDEVRALLSAGQPAADAAIPTLERHIEVLRDAIVRHAPPLVEIPPIPDGHPFLVCLTHDLDHPALRFHGLDHTTLGFLWRASLGSLLRVWRGRMPVASLRRNLLAALKLPFVHLGWAEDFWATFDRYLQIEKGLGSTFFVIPAKGRPGLTPGGPASYKRASVYGVADVAERVRSLAAAGSEVGVHGIDAWIDAPRGMEERRAVTAAVGVPALGVRMHWLFFDETAARRLENAGYAYDSTFGYNDTVGLRAGTLQVFKPLVADTLLELPLHVMDTALFYPTHLNLTPEAAKAAMWPLIDEAERHGGVLTVNWHDRSIAPERLWDDVYLDLLDELKRRNPWFPTAAQAVTWFQRRRRATLEAAPRDGGAVHVRASAERSDEQPGLRVRVHRGPSAFRDVPLRDALDMTVSA
jgi:hypothetical protein